MAKNRAVFGIYRTQSALENAVQVLRDERFSSSDVAVLLPESMSSRELGTQKASKAPEGATAGAGTGAVLGGVLGWLVGIGSLAIPGVGPFIAAGPIVAALAGAGVGGAVGGLAGALVGMGIPEYEKAASCSPYTVTPRTRLTVRKRSWNAQVPKTSLPPANRPQKKATARDLLLRDAFS